MWQDTFDNLAVIDDLHGLSGDLGLFGGALLALATSRHCGIAIPAVIPDELEALAGDVLRDGGDEVQLAERRRFPRTAGELLRIEH